MQVKGNYNLTTDFVKNNPSKISNNKNFKPQKISHSVYNSTCPIGANYYTPSFGLANPVSQMMRAKDLKSQYAQKGLNYLLPNEVLSKKKIFAVIKELNKKFDELLSENRLSTFSLNMALSTMIPAAIMSKICIKDFHDLKKDLEKDGYSYSQIASYQNTAGLARTKGDSTVIYVPLDNLQVKTKIQQLDSKATLGHELKHALTANGTNIYEHNKFNKTDYSDVTSTEERKLYSNIFKEFERQFNNIEMKGKPVNLERKSLLKHEGYKNLKSLHSDMSKKLDEIVTKYKEKTQTGLYGLRFVVGAGYATDAELNEAATDGVWNEQATEKICQKHPEHATEIREFIEKSKLPDNAFTSKNFYEYMQHRAMDEKEAYKTDDVYRALTNNPNQPLDYELRSLMYEEMEKFFAQKAKNAN